MTDARTSLIGRGQDLVLPIAIIASVLVIIVPRGLKCADRDASRLADAPPTGLASASDPMALGSNRDMPLLLLMSRA